MGKKIAHPTPRPVRIRGFQGQRAGAFSVHHHAAAEGDDALGEAL